MWRRRAGGGSSTPCSSPKCRAKASDGLGGVRPWCASRGSGGGPVLHGNTDLARFAAQPGLVAEIEAAVPACLTVANNLAEGAGAAALAALIREREAMKGRSKAAVVLSGGNIDRALYLRVLGEG